MPKPRSLRTAFIIARLRKRVRSSGVMMDSPSRRALNSAAFLIPARTNSGAPSTLFRATGSHSTPAIWVSIIIWISPAVTVIELRCFAAISAAVSSVGLTNITTCGSLLERKSSSRLSASSSQLSLRPGSSSASSRSSSLVLTSSRPSVWATSSATARTPSRRKDGVSSSRCCASAVQTR